MKNQHKINQSIQNGYSLDFSSVFEKCFETYKRLALQGGLVYILLSLVIFVIAFGAIGVFAGASSFTDFATNFNFLDFSFLGIIIYIILASFVGALIAPINAGLLKMSHLADQKKDLDVGIAFEFYKKSSFKDIFIASFLIALLGNGISILLDFSGIILLGALINYAVIFFTLLTLPLIIFSDLNATDAIKTSVQLVLKSPFVILGLILVAVIIAMLGIIGLCIGIFFTMPFINAMIYQIYDSIIPIEEKSEIDEIGKVEI